MKFEYYVLNHNFNKDKIELFNIFDNCYVQERTEKEIRKYLRSPKNYKYDSFFKDEEPIYGFDGLCKRFEQILRCEEWSRCEYEIAVGGMFITELSDIIRAVEREEITADEVYEEIQKKNKRNSKLEKWDCFQQAQKNIPMIMRECIWQYKQQKKKISSVKANTKIYQILKAKYLIVKSPKMKAKKKSIISLIKKLAQSVKTTMIARP